MRIKNPYEDTKMMTNKAVTELAIEVMRNLGFRSIDKELLIAEFNKVIPLPFMLTNAEIQLWVDKYYIAYSYTYEEAINYLYIADKHISEEEHSFSLNKDGLSMHQSIKDDFKRAKAQMNRTEKKYAIFTKRIVKFTKVHTENVI